MYECLFFILFLLAYDNRRVVGYRLPILADKIVYKVDWYSPNDSVVQCTCALQVMITEDRKQKKEYKFEYRNY